MIRGITQTTLAVLGLQGCTRGQLGDCVVLVMHLTSLLYLASHALVFFQGPLWLELSPGLTSTLVWTLLGLLFPFQAA